MKITRYFHHSWSMLCTGNVCGGLLCRGQPKEACEYDEVMTQVERMCDAVRLIKKMRHRKQQSKYLVQTYMDVCRFVDEPF